MNLMNQIMKFSYTHRVEEPSEYNSYNKQSTFKTNVNGDVSNWTLMISPTKGLIGDMNVKFAIQLLRVTELSIEKVIAVTVFLKNHGGKKKTRHFELPKDNYDDIFGKGYTIPTMDYGFKGDASSGSLQDVTVTCEIFFELPVVSVYSGSPELFVYQSNSAAGREVEFFKSSWLSDLRIVSCDGNEFRAHKLMLSMHGRVFSTMFSKEIDLNFERTIKLEEGNAAAVREMLRFIYTGEVQNLEEVAVHIFNITRSYKMVELEKFCEKKLIQGVSAKNFHHMSELAIECGLKDLQARLSHFCEFKNDPRLSKKPGTAE